MRNHDFWRVWIQGNLNGAIFQLALEYFKRVICVIILLTASDIK